MPPGVHSIDRCAARTGRSRAGARAGARAREGSSAVAAGPNCRRQRSAP
ncbi:MAG TPA: hypothetical protein VF188_14960 [Longimicrobiales bacterium]